MSTVTIGIIIFAVMLLLVFLGVPVFVSLMFSTIIGFFSIGGSRVLLSQLTRGFFNESVSYTFSVVPLFILLGILASETGIAENAFKAVRVWTGRQRGSLLYTTIVANALFGAISGNSVAGNSIFSKVAFPELEKAGYDRSLSLATIVASGNLGCLIPPSIPILQICLIAEISIGTALITGLAAGIILTIVLCISILVISFVRPRKIPQADTKVYPFRQKMKSLTLLIPIVVLFILIIGGSFFGWFPPTVGGAIGLVAVLIYAFSKKISIKEIFIHAGDSVVVFSMVFCIICCGRLFGRFISMCGLTSAIITWISNSGMAPILCFTIVVVFFGLLGCAMDSLTMIIVTVPILFPMLESIGMNEFVICILLVFIGELALITPPVGTGVFQVAALTGHSSKVIFKGVLPFVIVYLVCVYIIYLFPDIVLWLPRLLGA